MEEQIKKMLKIKKAETGASQSYSNVLKSMLPNSTATLTIGDL